MSFLFRSVALSLLMASLPLAAAPAATAPLHAQFLPADDLQLRAEAPEHQQLMLVTSYSVVVGSQRQSNQQPIPVTSPLLVRLKGKPMSQGATVREVLMTFDGESKSLKKPTFDSKTRTLNLSYPQSQYRVIMDLLRNDTVYVQFLTYANGHVWADLHTGSVRAR
ncbi:MULTISPECIES: hypothetical protein [Pseudomonas]|uniref:Uncharacterized protein n=1 Tax=Pseudomonas saxonica TaxID=2600598 RepID=A0A5C5Q0K4_9PSED|nr:MULTISPECIES: hypothetical protein [Pseudomonas]MCH4871854.1 hypothetical protein [Pseudomonas sp. TMW22091]TWR93077.1 hypothetical protein FJD38_05555 [Pseudomonas saxonica]TWR97748.1 hypothetical protein FJD37_06695 [Pseudomonas saxonica]WRQ73404.1 hypothetical protein VQY67_14590 [Pseudomonas saxonica]